MNVALAMSNERSDEPEIAERDPLQFLDESVTRRRAGFVSVVDETRKEHGGIVRARTLVDRCTRTVYCGRGSQPIGGHEHQYARPYGLLAGHGQSATPRAPQLHDARGHLQVGFGVALRPHAVRIGRVAFVAQRPAFRLADYQRPEGVGLGRDWRLHRGRRTPAGADRQNTPAQQRVNQRPLHLERHSFDMSLTKTGLACVALSNVINNGNVTVSFIMLMYFIFFEFVK